MVGDDEQDDGDHDEVDHQSEEPLLQHEQLTHH